MQTAIEAQRSPGQTLRALRTAKRWTQPKLAVKAGVAIGTISFAERDQRYPDPIRRMAIAKALGVEPEQIWPEETAA